MFVRWLSTGAVAFGLVCAAAIAASASDSRMVDEQSLADAAQAGGWPTSLSPCANPEEVTVDPENIQETIDARKSGCTRLLLLPGIYKRLRVYDANGVTLRCQVPRECRVDTVVLARVQYAEITGMHFTGTAVRLHGSTDYGVQIHHVKSILISGNTFEGRYNHDISTKEYVGYTEITNNLFIRCDRHCVEIGQNGNVKSRGSQSGIAYIANNTFDHALINAITQRNNNLLIVYNNTFKNAGQYAVQNWPLWQRFNYGQSSGPEANLLMDGTLRTEIVENTFLGRNVLSFEGRGKSADSLLIRSNKGDFTCKRAAMPERAKRAHVGIETTAPPRVDPQSDKTC